QKAIKIISIIMVAIGFIVGIMSLANIFTGGAGLAFTSETATSAEVLGTGIGLLLVALVNILIGFCGLRGAKNASKIKPFYFFSIVGLLLSAAGIISGLTQGQGITAITSHIVSLLLIIICVLLANNVRHQG
ncbi:MAG: hypothetical protein RR362_00005, partial [Raoultibacter sp.]